MLTFYQCMDCGSRDISIEAIVVQDRSGRCDPTDVCDKGHECNACGSTEIEWRDATDLGGQRVTVEGDELFFGYVVIYDIEHVDEDDEESYYGYFDSVEEALERFNVFRAGYNETFAGRERVHNARLCRVIDVIPDDKTPPLSVDKLADSSDPDPRPTRVRLLVEKRYPAAWVAHFPSIEAGRVVPVIPADNVPEGEFWIALPELIDDPYGILLYPGEYELVEEDES